MNCPGLYKARSALSHTQVLDTSASITPRLIWIVCLENAFCILCSVVLYRHRWPDQETSSENTGKVFQFSTSSWKEHKYFGMLASNSSPPTPHSTWFQRSLCSPGFYGKTNTDFGIWEQGSSPDSSTNDANFGNLIFVNLGFITHKMEIIQFHNPSSTIPKSKRALETASFLWICT